jgi:hypothetical protein
LASAAQRTHRIVARPVRAARDERGALRACCSTTHCISSDVVPTADRFVRSQREPLSFNPSPLQTRPRRTPDARVCETT